MPSPALPSLPKQLTLPNPLWRPSHGLPAPTVFDPAFLASVLFDPVTAGLYSRRATARAPPSPRVPGPGNSRPSLREAVLLEGLGGTNRSDMGLNLSGSWQQGHSATYNTPSRI